MKTILSNYKTTAAGLALIFVAFGDLANQAATGAWDGNHLMADWTGVVTGIGLVVAHDGVPKK